MNQTAKYTLMLFYSNLNRQSLRARVAISEFASECGYLAELILKEVDYDSDKSQVLQYGVQGIPTLLFFRGETLLGRHLGEITTQDIKSIFACDQAADTDRSGER